jgi:hypothetical protein
MRFLRVGPAGAERPAVLDAGVAFGAKDFPYLRAGDVVELEIDRLGRQRHVLGQA